jgi:hypothetical protein
MAFNSSNSHGEITLKIKLILFVLLVTIASLAQDSPSPTDTQWIKVENKNLISGKTTLSFNLQSQSPEKALMIVDGCLSKKKGVAAFVVIAPGFQIRMPRDTTPGGLVRVPARFDRTVKPILGSVVGDLDNAFKFTSFNDKMFDSKEIVIQFDEFAGPQHQLVFRLDSPPPLPDCPNNR